MHAFNCNNNEDNGILWQQIPSKHKRLCVERRSEWMFGIWRIESNVVDPGEWAYLWNFIKIVITTNFQHFFSISFTTLFCFCLVYCLLDDKDWVETLRFEGFLFFWIFRFFSRYFLSLIKKKLWNKKKRIIQFFLSRNLHIFLTWENWWDFFFLLHKKRENEAKMCDEWNRRYLLNKIFQSTWVRSLECIHQE